jgi:hypothetical protein
VTDHQPQPLLASVAAFCLAFAALLAGPAAVQAHHSFAMFDATKSVSQKGTVKEVQWTNPHVWLKLTVTEQDKTVQLDYEGAAIAVLKRANWLKDTVKPGDEVTVTGHPYKDGRGGGSIDYLVLADGRKVGAGNVIPGAYVVPGVN